MSTEAGQVLPHAEDRDEGFKLLLDGTSDSALYLLDWKTLEFMRELKH